MEHNLIWHPYVNEINNSYIADICLTRRLEKTRDYQMFLSNVLKIALAKVTDFMTIKVILEYRDSMDILASIDYFKPTNLVTYNDEYLEKSKNQKYDKWVKNVN